MRLGRQRDLGQDPFGGRKRPVLVLADVVFLSQIFWAMADFSESVSFSSLGGCDAFHLLFDTQMVVFAEAMLWCRKFLGAKLGRDILSPIGMRPTWFEAWPVPEIESTCECIWNAVYPCAETLVLGFGLVDCCRCGIPETPGTLGRAAYGQHLQTTW